MRKTTFSNPSKPLAVSQRGESLGGLALKSQMPKSQKVDRAMANFLKKRGAVGWPNPQAAQIERMAGRYGLSVDRHTAQTGTVYLTIDAEDGESISVRVADHGDAYASADFTVDPQEDHRPAVKAWIAAHGVKPSTAPAREYGRLRREFIARFGDAWLLMEDGTKWRTIHEKYAPGKLFGGGESEIEDMKRALESGNRALGAL